MAKSYEELLTKVTDCSRRRKFDSSAKEKIQQGGDPKDVGVVGEWSWGEDAGGGYDRGDGVYALGFKDHSKGKWKG